MKSIHWDRARLFALSIGLFLLLAPRNLWADDSGVINQILYGRTYFGILGTSVSSGGTGFGTATLLNEEPYEVTLAPAVSQNFGWGVFLGRREGSYAAEVSFWQSTHDSSWKGTYPVGGGGTVAYGKTLHGTATLDAIDIDFKRFFLTDLPVQPFVGLGVNIPWLTFMDASANTSSVGNAVFEGVGFDLGAGLEYYLNSTFSIVGGFYQKWSGFGQYKGVNGVDNQVQGAVGKPSSFDGSGLDFYIGTSVGFM